MFFPLFVREGWGHWKIDEHTSFNRENPPIRMPEFLNMRNKLQVFYRTPRALLHFAFVTTGCSSFSHPLSNFYLPQIFQVVPSCFKLLKGPISCPYIEVESEEFVGGAGEREEGWEIMIQATWYSSWNRKDSSPFLNSAKHPSRFFCLLGNRSK